MSRSDESTRDFWRVLISYFLPPVGVFLEVGLGMAFWVNLVLTLLGFLPGQLHAVWVIATRDEHGREVRGGQRTFFALILALWLPPVGILLRKGLGLAFLVNCLLTLFFWIPGVLHAAWVITDQDS